MKKVLIAIFLLGALVLSTACDPKDNQKEQGTTTQKTTVQTTPEDEETVSILPVIIDVIID
jgi:hypothetical protein